MGYSIQQVKAIVETEGLDYAIMDYLGAEVIEDRKLANAWKEAEKALKKVDEILSSVEDEEEDE